MNDRVANFGEQVGTLLPRLRRFARALTRHPQDADDLVQLAVERALTRSTQWRPDSSLTNWMLAIVRNAWIDETRSRRSRDAVLVPENEAVEVGDTGTDRDIEWWSIQSALERLPEEQRLAVALVLIEGLSYREAAQVMEVPIGTLTSRLARGRLALQSMLTDPVDYARGAQGQAMTVTDEELMAYVDGELDAARLESLRQEIAASADLSRRVAEQRALRDRLHRAFDPALHEPVPARLTELTVRARVVEFAFVDPSSAIARRMAEWTGTRGGHRARHRARTRAAATRPRVSRRSSRVVPTWPPAVHSPTPCRSGSRRSSPRRIQSVWGLVSWRRAVSTAARSFRSTATSPWPAWPVDRAPPGESMRCNPCRSSRRSPTAIGRPPRPCHRWCCGRPRTRWRATRWTQSARQRHATITGRRLP